MATTGKLIVLAAFDKNEEGDLVPAFDPRQVDTENAWSISGISCTLD